MDDLRVETLRTRQIQRCCVSHGRSTRKNAPHATESVSCSRATCYTSLSGGVSSMRAGAMMRVKNMSHASETQKPATTSEA